MLPQEKSAFLRDKALNIRVKIIEMLAESGSGHPGGSLSAADIITALYFQAMKIDPKNPGWSQRDRFVLCKGHAAPVLYAALAHRGYFPEEELMTLRKLGSRLQGHPDMNKTPGVDISTGSLGQGLSVAVGMALGLKLNQQENFVCALLGDGEVQEGQVWEAAMAGAHYKLDNLIAILDYNGLQIDGPIKSIMSPEPLVEKWEAFGWRVIQIDGHDITAIVDALLEARNVKGKPTILVASTIKGKGVSFMENQVDWHGNAPKKEQAEQALRELISGGTKYES